MMHFEILIEDLSGKAALDILMPQITGENHTSRVISYRGIGRIPKNLKSRTDARDRILLGDISAIRKAYPRAIGNVLNSYQNDAICDTWEHLADAIYPGGAKALQSQPWYVIGKEKSTWAEKITPFMNINKNKSPSFCHFRDKIQELI